MPVCDGDLLDLVPDALERLGPGRRRAGRPASRRSPSPAGAVGRGDLLGSRLTRPSRFVVVPSSRRPGGGEHDVGLAAEVGEEAVHRDHGASAGEPLAGEVGVGEVGERIGPQEHEDVDLAAGGGLEDAAASRPRSPARWPTRAALNHGPRRVRPGRAGRGRGPCPGRRARCRGAGRSGTARRGGPRGWRRRRPRRRRTTRPGAGAPEDDGDRTAGRGAPPWRRRRARPPTSWAAEPASSADLTGGAWAVEAAWPRRGRRRTSAAELDDLHRASRGRRRSRRKRTGSSSLRSGAEHEHRRRAAQPRRWWRGAGRARPQRAARRRAGRRRGRCRAPPWPAWPRRRRSRW